MMTQKQAALQLLSELGPLHIKVMVSESSARGLYTSVRGKTPEQTLHAQLLKEERVEKVSPGTFGLKPFFTCNSCSKPIVTEERVEYFDKFYCGDCYRGLGGAGKKVDSKLRKKSNPYEYWKTHPVALEYLGVLLRTTDVLRYLLPGSALLEPTDGNGVIGNYLRQIYQVTSSDIEPRISWVSKMDFFDIHRQYAAIVFNPPFEEFKKSQKWLKHALAIAPVVIALLPQRFQNNKKGLIKHLYRIANIPNELWFEGPYPNHQIKPLRGLKMTVGWFVWLRDYTGGSIEITLKI